MSLYRQVMIDSPAVYWPFQESSDGSTCSDASGNARNGTEVGTGASLASTEIVPGHRYSCLNSGDGYWNFNNVAALDVGTGDFTHEIWFKINNGTSDYVEVMGRDHSATGNGQMLYLNITDGFARIYTGGTTTVAGTSRLSDDKLHHVVYRRISGTHSVVVDGTQQGSAAAAGNTDTANRNLRVGVAQGVYQRPLGRWAHYAYYTTGLTDARITAHYEAGMRGGVSY